MTGTVIDTQGDPIIGASVWVEGTTRGTVTDVDGNFTLSVAPDEMVRVSYVGYDEVVVEASSITLRVVLQEDTKTLRRW